MGKRIRVGYSNTSYSGSTNPSSGSGTSSGNNTPSGSGNSGSTSPVDQTELNKLIQKLNDYGYFQYDTPNKRVIVTEFFPVLGTPEGTYHYAEFQYPITSNVEITLASAREKTGNQSLNIFDFIHIGSANGPTVNQSGYKDYFSIVNGKIRISANILSEPNVTTSDDIKSITLYIDDTELSTAAGFRDIQPNDAAWLLVSDEESQGKFLIYPNRIVTDLNGNTIGYFNSMGDLYIGAISNKDGMIVVSNVNLNDLQVTSLAQINGNSTNTLSTPTLDATPTLDPQLEHPWVNGTFNVNFIPSKIITKNGITCRYTGSYKASNASYIYGDAITLTMPEVVSLVDNRSNGSFTISANGNVITIDLGNEYYYHSLTKQIIVAESETTRYVIKLNGEPDVLPPCY